MLLKPYRALGNAQNRQDPNTANRSALAAYYTPNPTGSQTNTSVSRRDKILQSMGDIHAGRVNFRDPTSGAISTLTPHVRPKSALYSIIPDMLGPISGDMPSSQGPQAAQTPPASAMSQAMAPESTQAVAERQRQVSALDSLRQANAEASNNPPMSVDERIGYLLNNTNTPAASLNSVWQNMQGTPTDKRNQLVEAGKMYARQAHAAAQNQRAPGLDEWQRGQMDATATPESTLAYARKRAEDEEFRNSPGGRNMQDRFSSDAMAARARGRAELDRMDQMARLGGIAPAPESALSLGYYNQDGSPMDREQFEKAYPEKAQEWEERAREREARFVERGQGTEEDRRVDRAIARARERGQMNGVLEKHLKDRGVDKDTIRTVLNTSDSKKRRRSAIEKLLKLTVDSGAEASGSNSPPLLNSPVSSLQREEGNAMLAEIQGGTSEQAYISRDFLTDSGMAEASHINDFVSPNMSTLYSSYEQLGEDSLLGFGRAIATQMQAQYKAQGEDFTAQMNFGLGNPTRVWSELEALAKQSINLDLEDDKAVREWNDSWRAAVRTLNKEQSELRKRNHSPDGGMSTLTSMGSPGL